MKAKCCPYRQLHIPNSTLFVGLVGRILPGPHRATGVAHSGSNRRRSIHDLGYMGSSRVAVGVGDHDFLLASKPYPDGDVQVRSRVSDLP